MRLILLRFAFIIGGWAIYHFGAQPNPGHQQMGWEMTALAAVTFLGLIAWGVLDIAKNKSEP